MVGQRRSRVWGAAAMLVAVTLLGGCGEPDEQQVRDSVAASESSVKDAVNEIHEALGASGLEFESASGEWESCRTQPEPGFRFYASGPLQDNGEDPAARVQAATEALERLGWSVTDAGSEPRPYATLEQGESTLTVAESKVNPGSVSLGVRGECLDSTQDLAAELIGESQQLLP